MLVADEIDLFTIFCNGVDMPAKLGQVGEGDLAVFPSGQAQFDDYHGGLRGIGPTSTLPRLRLTTVFRRFARDVERAQPKGWLGAAAVVFQLPESLQVAWDTPSFSISLLRELKRKSLSSRVNPTAE